MCDFVGYINVGQVSARSLADRKRICILKPGPSPMDKKPDIVTLKEGDLVSRVQAKSILGWRVASTDKGMDNGTMRTR